MPKKNIKKGKGRSRGDYHRYSDEQLKSAIQAVREGMSVREAAKKFDVPRATVSDKKNGKTEVGVTSGRKPFLSKEIEKKLVDNVTSAAAKGFGVSKKQFMVKVGTLCQKTGVARFKNGVPGKDWWYSFSRRNPEISLRKPEKLGNMRAKMLNPQKVNNYFDDLEKLVKELDLTNKPQFIWNADETGKQFQHNPVNVIAQKGARGIVSRTSDDRTNTTMMVCANAAGQFMPPMMIVKGKTSKSLYGFNTAEAPENTIWTFQEKAWMNDSIMLQWFRDVFLPNCGEHRPQLLIVDGHGSHESAEILTEAIESGIRMFAFPPHTTHFLQPMDRTVFGPFNAAYDQACSDFLSARVCNNINKWTFPPLVNKAWKAAMTPSNAVSGFKACGIYPVNRHAIPRSAFEPSECFDKMCVQDDQNDDTTITESNKSYHVDDVPMETNVDRSKDAPVIHTEVAEQVEQPRQLLVPLQPNFDENLPVIEDPALLLDLIQTGKLDVVATADENGIAEIPTNTCLWSEEIENLFVPQQDMEPSQNKSQLTTKKSKKITSHRLLTSPEILEEKRKLKEEKEKKELQKKERMQRRLEKRLDKENQKKIKKIKK
ncbi:hypothetical protein FSP39_025431 [Pinctada imbricata]|uniref:HTH psq-type domain-containing protein n=1 Tax=Pinctada imbricata TaxID=66713 RepID=A0AA89CBR2_PINIB|nr:hypothetical protein FSP39_025431 [Pinctada imbricata]